MVELYELALKRPTASGARDESRRVGRRVLQVIEYLLTMQPWNSVRFSKLWLSAMFLGHLDCRWRHPNCWGNFPTVHGYIKLYVNEAAAAVVTASQTMRRASGDPR